MLTLVVGGAASGKSAFAEELLLRADAASRVYLATMEPRGAEAAVRIARHRALRRGKGFVTVECPTAAERAAISPDSAVLLEDIGNLCANELFSLRGAGADAAKTVVRAVARLREHSRALIVVSNEVFCGGADYGAEMLRYLSALARVNRALAAMADEVYEVSAGVARRVVPYAGELPSADGGVFRAPARVTFPAKEK